MSKFNKKVALITGGASGLGRAIARRFASEGAAVVITDVDGRQGREVAASFGIHFIEQDVTEEARWAVVVREVQERYGELHVLVNNAGILGSSDLFSPRDTSLSDWRAVFAVNVEGVFLGCRETIPAIHAAGGGAIVNISSIAGLLATPHATAYGASKAAVAQLTKSVAQFSAQHKLHIRCNSVHPGDVRTPLWERRAEENAWTRGVSVEQIIQEAKTSIPLGEFTAPEDIAAMVSFLASEDASHITGAEFVVDGGVYNCNTFRSDRAVQAGGGVGTSGEV